MSGPALSQEQIEARRKAQADLELMATEALAADRDERRAARIGSVAQKVAPLNKRILHSRLSWRKRRAKARVAKQSRKVNRV